MDHNGFRRARADLGLTQEQLAGILGIDRKTVQRYEAAPETRFSRPVNPIAARVMSWLMAGFRPPQWPRE